MKPAELHHIALTFSVFTSSSDVYAVIVVEGKMSTVQMPSNHVSNNIMQVILQVQTFPSKEKETNAGASVSVMENPSETQPYDSSCRMRTVGSVL